MRSMWERFVCAVCERDLLLLWYVNTLIIVRMTMMNDGIYAIVWLWIEIMRM